MKHRRLPAWLFLNLLGVWLAAGGHASAAVETSSSLREIAVKVAASETFQYDENWQKDIQERMSFVNEVFEPLFNIHFRVMLHLPWNLKDETQETDLLMEDLNSQIPMDRDQVVIGFHKMSQPYGEEKLVDHDRVGSARYFRGLMVIRDPFLNMGDLPKRIVLLHEMAHLFGAVHISDQGAVMNPVLPMHPSLTLDATNQEVIRATRAVDFTQGIDSLSDEAKEILIQIYERKIRENPHSDFYDQLGRFYQNRGQSAKAIAIWEEALRDNFANPSIHYELGIYYYQNARYDRAVPELGSAVAHYVLPSQKKMQAAALNMLGVSYYEQGNTELAIFNWLKGLSASPDDPILQGNLALAYLTTGHAERAVAELEKLAAKNPDDLINLGNLGTAYLEVKDSERAVEVLSRALSKKIADLPASNKKTPVSQSGSLSNEVSEAELRLNLGAAYLNLKKYDEAALELEKSRQLDPKNYEVHINLAQAYLAQANFLPAIKEIDEAIRYKNESQHLLALKSQAYAGAKQMPEAIAEARKAIRLDPRSDLAAQLYRNISATLYEQGKRVEAKQEIKQALAIRWKDAESHYILGLLEAQSGQMESALRSLKTALDQDPNHERAKQLRDQILQQTKKP